MREPDLADKITSGESALIDSMGPDQVCEELVRLGGAIDEETRRDRPGPTDKDVDTDPSDVEQRMERLFREIQALPGRDIAHARMVYLALSTSDYKHFAATLMADLAEADLGYALPIWEGLMGDPDLSVRYPAYSALVHDAPKRDAIQMDFRSVIPLFEAYRIASTRNERR